MGYFIFLQVPKWKKMSPVSLDIFRVCLFIYYRLRQSFFSIDRAAMTKNATPAHQRLPVKNQTIIATIAAGISIKIRRIRKIMMMPIMIRATIPRISFIGRLNSYSDSEVVSEDNKNIFAQQLKTTNHV